MDKAAKADDQNMLDAVHAVVYGNMSIRLATKKYGVVRSTLQRRVHAMSKDGDGVSKVGDAASPKKEDAPSTPPQMALPPPVPLRTAAPEVVKGPYKVINCKVRTMQTAASSAIDELSNEMVRAGRPVFKLGLGQSPFPVPDCIVDELKSVEPSRLVLMTRRANAHQRDYLPVAGLAELRQDIATWATENLKLPYTKDDVLVGPGTKELLFVLQTVYYGDLLLPNPSCTSYAPQANIAGRNMIWLPTYAEDRWVLRPGVLEAQCAMDPYAPRILILNSPSNPTGCSYSDADLQAIAALAKKYRMLVVSDEIYSDLTYEPHISISKYYPEGTIVSGGLSKWCGAGGWRVGFWLFSASLNWLRQSMLVMASETYTSVASPIQYAARRAFVPGCPELSAYKQKCRRTLQVVAEWCTYQLHKMNIQVHPPQGGFHVFPCFRNYRQKLAARNILTDVEMCERLLADTGVAMLPGSYFGRAAHELYARIAFVDFKGEIAMYVIGSEGEYGVNDREGFIRSVCPNLWTAMELLGKWLQADEMQARQERNRSFLEAVERLGYAPQGMYADASPLELKDVDSLMRGSLEPVWLWVAQNVHAPGTMEMYRRNLLVARQEMTNGRAERQRKRDACAALKEKKAYLERTLAHLRSESQKDIAMLTSMEHQERTFCQEVRDRQRSQVLLHSQASELHTAQATLVMAVAESERLLVPQRAVPSTAGRNVVDQALDTLRRDCALQRDQLDPPVTNLVADVCQMCNGLAILEQLQHQPQAQLPHPDAERPAPAQDVDTLTSVHMLLQERQRHHIQQFVVTMKLRQETAKALSNATPALSPDLPAPLRALVKADEARAIALAVHSAVLQYEREVEAAIAEKAEVQSHIQAQVHEIQSFEDRFAAKTREISVAFRRNRALVCFVLDLHTQLLRFVQANVLEPFADRLTPLEQKVLALAAEERTSVTLPKPPVSLVDKISDPHDPWRRLAHSLDVPDYASVPTLLRALDGDGQLRLYEHVQRM
ncbi:aspartate aminotransferase [Achlya hypogyna]|uniref:Aspartate aminotransferase n=1 Tax=Achlya hypogyna TaxID=1202772 RepID=A0A1V9Z9B1_ACHHY|nr:aspartate aminotransferase [Achlya hypogyna]